MKKYLIWLLIALAVGAVLLLLINQGLFTAVDEVIEPAEDDVEVADDRAAPVKEEDASVEEKVVIEAIDEETDDEVTEPAGDESDTVADEAEFTITDSPYQDYIRARQQGEPIVLKFYSET